MATDEQPYQRWRYPPGCPDSDWCAGNRMCYWRCQESDDDVTEMPNRQFDRRYYYSSAYRKARNMHNCGDCRQAITRGQLYLFFVPREREHIDVCLGCSVKKNSDRSHRWPCSVVRERIEQLGDKAGEQMQGSLL